MPQLNLAKFKKLEIHLNMWKGTYFTSRLSTLSLNSHISVHTSVLDNENAVYESLKNISKLKHLIRFQLYIYWQKNNNLLIGLLKQMSKNCQNLKSIVCRFNRNQNSDIKELLSQLKEFPALKRLNLWYFFSKFHNEVSDEDIDVNQLFSFELFKGFENITHLTLRLDQTLKESTLKEIDINLPKLQYLRILVIVSTQHQKEWHKWQIFWADSQDWKHWYCGTKSESILSQSKNKSLKSVGK